MYFLYSRKMKYASVLGLLVLCTSPLKAQESTAPKSTTVATFKGTTITEEELRKAAAADLEKLSIQVQGMNANVARAEHQILETDLNRLLTDKLFEAEAAKLGISEKEYLEKELAGKIKEPSDQDVKAFYEANAQRVNKPLDQVADQIKQYLNTENRNKALSDLADRLKADYGANVLLQPLRAKVGTEGSPSLGPKEAPVTIVEFSDFQCPFCSRLSQTLHQVVEKYGNEVRVVYRQFPLSQLHPNAEKAAEASLCAAEQNRFWDLHNLMFETQNQLSEEDLKAKAVTLKLDSGAFDTCLTTGKYAGRVQQDQRDGYMLGVSSTPSMFVNGRFLTGALPLSDLSKILDEEISLNSPRTASTTVAPAAGGAQMSSAKMP